MASVTEVILRKLMLIPLIGCGRDDSTLEPVGETGAHLSVVWSEQADVVGVQVEARRVACTSEELPPSDQRVEQLVAQSPGRSPELFLALEPGCWDLWAMPAAAFEGETFTPSAECSTARSPVPVRIAPHVTTHVQLQSWCEGDPAATNAERGYNSPPTVREVLSQDEADECTPIQTCVLALDAEDDPLEVEWVARHPASPYRITAQPPRLLGIEEGQRQWELCAEIVPQGVGPQVYEVYLYDLALQAGQPVRWDEAGPPSHASVQWVSTSHFVLPPACVDATGEPQPTAPLPGEPGCELLDPELFYCSGDYSSGEPSDLYCDSDAQLLPSTLWSPCDQDSDADTDTDLG
jgi:hypothetical protein